MGRVRYSGRRGKKGRSRWSCKPYIISSSTKTLTRVIHTVRLTQTDSEKVGCSPEIPAKVTRSNMHACTKIKFKKTNNKQARSLLIIYTVISGKSGMSGDSRLLHSGSWSAFPVLYLRVPRLTWCLGYCHTSTHQSFELCLLPTEVESKMRCKCEEMFSCYFESFFLSSNLPLPCQKLAELILVF